MQPIDWSSSYTSYSEVVLKFHLVRVQDRKQLSGVYNGLTNEAESLSRFAQQFSNTHICGQFTQFELRKTVWTWSLCTVTSAQYQGLTC